MRRSRAPLLAAALMACTPLLAQPPSPWYGGVAGGQSRTGHELVANRESTIVNGSSVSSDFGATDAGWKVFAGWRLNSRFALEASYADLGESRLVTHTSSIDQIPGSIDIHRKVCGFALDALFSAPLGERFAIFGRAGMGQLRLREDASLDGGIVFTNGSADERSRTVALDQTVGHFGAGGEWRVRDDIFVRLEWERFRRVGKAFEVGGSGTTGEADSDLLSLGVRMRF